MGNCLITRRGGGNSGLPKPGDGQLIYNTALPEEGMSVKDYSVIAGPYDSGGYYIIFIQENLLLRAGGNAAYAPLVRKLGDSESVGFNAYCLYYADTKIIKSTTNSSKYFFLYK